MKLCISGLHPWIGFQLQDIAPRTFEQLSSIVTNMELHLAANPRLLATFKAGTEANRLRKAAQIKNAAAAEVANNNSWTHNREPKNISSSGSCKTVHTSSSYSKGKEKAIILCQEEVLPRPPRQTFEKRKNKFYGFKRDKVAKLFQKALKSGRLTLPNPTRPKQVAMVNEPNYCSFHRNLNHTIEDCFPFKDWLEKVIKDGFFALT